MSNEQTDDLVTLTLPRAQAEALLRCTEIALAAHDSQPRTVLEPLTRQQIDKIMTQHYPLDSLLRENVDAFEACVRDIERAHGIGLADRGQG
jgi:hypothetical protein